MFYSALFIGDRAGGAHWGNGPTNFFESDSAPTKFEICEGTLACRRATECDTRVCLLNLLAYSVEDEKII